jgi:hypothetical protein
VYVWNVVKDSSDGSTLFYNVTLGSPGWLERQVWYSFNTEHNRLEYSIWDPLQGWSWIYMSPGGQNVEYQILWQMFEPAHLVADADFVNYIMDTYQDPPVSPQLNFSEAPFPTDTSAPAGGTGAGTSWSGAWWPWDPTNIVREPNWYLQTRAQRTTDQPKN